MTPEEEVWRRIWNPQTRWNETYFPEGLLQSPSRRFYVGISHKKSYSHSSGLFETFLVCTLHLSRVFIYLIGFQLYTMRTQLSITPYPSAYMGWKNFDKISWIFWNICKWQRGTEMCIYLQRDQVSFANVPYFNKIFMVSLIDWLIDSDKKNVKRFWWEFIVTEIWTGFQMQVWWASRAISLQKNRKEVFFMSKNFIMGLE